VIRFLQPGIIKEANVYIVLQLDVHIFRHRVGVDLNATVLVIRMKIIRSSGMMSTIPKGLFQAPLFLSMNTGIHQPVTHTINHPPSLYRSADDKFSNTFSELVISMAFLCTAS